MDPTKNSHTNYFNWGKMLSEDLEEMLKSKMLTHQEDFNHKKMSD